MSARRFSCAGVGEIVRYNWGQYLAAGGVILVLALAAYLSARLQWPVWISAGALLGLALAVWWTLASLAASWWIYDLSPLRRWEWLEELVSFDGKRWVYVHTGLDECGWQLRRNEKLGPGLVMDTYSPAVMTEPSIQRARLATGTTRRPDVTARWDAWPVWPGQFDLCFFIMAAHELRRRDERLALFREAAAALRPGGKVVLVEHARDVANFLAFGPGFMHFWPESEWDSLAEEAGLVCSKRGRLAGFIATRVYEKKEG